MVQPILSCLIFNLVGGLRSLCRGIRYVMHDVKLYINHTAAANARSKPIPLNCWAAFFAVFRMGTETKISYSGDTKKGSPFSLGKPWALIVKFVLPRGIELYCNIRSVLMFL
jgi:hypothetical protein